MAAIVRPRFYPLFAVLLAIVVFAGFARTFYLSYLFETLRPLTLLTILHGVVFTAWMALFVVQTRLIAANKARTHMQVGVAGVVIAALVVSFGIATAVVSASAARPRPMGMTSEQFVFVPLSLIMIFGGLVIAAVSLRKRPQLHKRLMTLAMITILPPATARLILLFGANLYFLPLQIASTALFVICCVLYDWFKHRVLHPVYLVGGTLLVLAWPFRVWFAHTETWAVAGKWLASL